MGSCPHGLNSPVCMPTSNQGLARRELEAVHLTENSMVPDECLRVRLDRLGGTEKEQENLPGENYIS